MVQLLSRSQEASTRWVVADIVSNVTTTNVSCRAMDGRMLMKGPVLSLILLMILGIDAHWLAGSALTSLPSECPTLNVEAPKDVDKSELIFKAIVSGPKLTNGSLKYKWSVDGGEMKDGQGTASVTIINFNLRK